jgi:hypothetical protein
MTNAQMTNESAEPATRSTGYRHSSFGIRHSFVIGISSFVIVPLLTGTVQGEDMRASTVGMPARIEQLVLPGPELEAKPIDNRKARIVLRVINAYPHGTAFRYDLSYYGLVPGKFDLKDYLQRKDSSSTADLPSIPVTIEALLPPGQIAPHSLEARPAPWLGGYRIALIAGGVFWVLGLLAILFLGRRRKGELTTANERAVTLADRLRPLVEKAMAGRLSQAERASLERILLAYWRRRLSLAEQKPAEAFALLRQHPEAGPLLEQLEAWLHRPDAPEQVDIAALLRPYQDEKLMELSDVS